VLIITRRAGERIMVGGGGGGGARRPGGATRGGGGARPPEAGVPRHARLRYSAAAIATVSRFATSTEDR
jgi:hypothetical protein